MKTSQALAKLRSMATQAGEALFERAGLAAQVLADKLWIDTEFCGDTDKATDALEADCFPELSLAFRLRKLLVLRREFTTLESWCEHKFNLQRLWAEHEEREKAARGEKPKVERERFTIADREERDNRIKELEFVVKQNAEQIQTKDEKIKAKESEVVQVMTENTRLRDENAQLRGEVRVLNQMMDKMRRERSSI